MSVTAPLTVTASASATTVDAGQSVNLTATASGGTSPYTYTWTFGDGNTGSGPSASHSYGTAGTYTATVTATDSTNPQHTATDSVTITVSYGISGSVTLNGSGLSDVKVSTDASHFAYTTSSGTFTITGLSNGTYTVTPVLIGYTFSPASQSVTINGANVTGVNFTASVVTYSISGTVTHDGSGLPSATMTLTLNGTTVGSQQTSTGGTYSFTGLTNGTYVVTPSVSDYVFTPASQNVTVNYASVAGVNFSGSIQGVAGTITITGTDLPLPGSTVAVAGSAGTFTGATSDNGAYSIGGVPDGTYTVTPSLGGYTFSPTSQTVQVSGAYTTGVDFAATPPAGTYSISGKLKITGMISYGAIPVTLSGAASASTTTDNNGNYIFTGLGNGTYTVTVGQDLVGPVIIYNKTSKTTTISGADVILNFSGSVCTKCTAGTVALADGTPLVGVTVTASNAQATTDSTGQYVLQAQGHGASQPWVQGTIVPSKQGYTFDPGNRPCDHGHTTHQDFKGQRNGAAPASASVNEQMSSPDASSTPAPGDGSAQNHDSIENPNRPSGGPGPNARCGSGGVYYQQEEAPVAETDAIPDIPAAPANATQRFYAWDHLGSVRVVTNETGTAVDKHDFEPYGVEILPSTNTAVASHLYDGQERDENSGLDYMHYRYYGSSMGRFMSPDNVPGNANDPQSWNMYAYVRGNPVSFNDPTGHNNRPPPPLVFGCGISDVPLVWTPPPTLTDSEESGITVTTSITSIFGNFGFTFSPSASASGEFVADMEMFAVDRAFDAYSIVSAVTAPTAEEIAAYELWTGFKYSGEFLGKVSLGWTIYTSLKYSYEGITSPAGPQASLGQRVGAWSAVIAGGVIVVVNVLQPETTAVDPWVFAAIGPPGFAAGVGATNLWRIYMPDYPGYPWPTKQAPWPAWAPFNW